MSGQRWEPFALPAEGAALVREIFAAQEEHGRAHPGLWIPAPPMAFRIRPKRSTTPALEIGLVSSRDDGKRMARWDWSLNTDLARLRNYRFVEDDPEHLAWCNRELTKEAMCEAVAARRNALLVATFGRFATEDHPFAGLAYCGICGRALTDADSIARGIGPECVAMWIGPARSERMISRFIVARVGATP